MSRESQARRESVLNFFSASSERRGEAALGASLVSRDPAICVWCDFIYLYVKSYGLFTHGYKCVRTGAVMVYVDVRWR